MLRAARLGQQHAGVLEKHQLGWDTGTGVFSAWWGENEMKSWKVLPAAVTPRPLTAQPLTAPLSGLSLSTSPVAGVLWIWRFYCAQVPELVPKPARTAKIGLCATEDTSSWTSW